MKNWHIVHDSRIERPEVIDNYSSPTTVYQRRNIEQVTITHDDKSYTEWQYEQREMTTREYISMQANLLEEQATALCELAELIGG